MKIISDKVEMIFRKDFNGKPYYSIGLSRTNKNGEYINGYCPIYFRNGVELENKTKIKIKDAWLDFYLKDGETKLNIFCNEFEKIGEVKKESEKSVDGWTSPKDIEIEPDELPFY